MMKKFTKIIATLGPQSDTIEKISALNNAGMNICRLNFSHGNYDYFKQIIKNIREVDSNLGILLDTKGPEIRTQKLLNNELFLEENEKIIFTNKELKSDIKYLIIHYEKIMEVPLGSKILLDDGLIETKVINILDVGLEVEVLNSGILGSSKTVSIQDYDVHLEFLSNKDKEDLLFGLKNNVDFIAASFVRNSENILELKSYLKKHLKKSQVMPFIIAKIEHPRAVENIDSILEVSDGIMIARGDLGVELPLELVPGYQQEIIQKANFLGKPVIVATQMLESMKTNPRPTRAEVSDVAHAILLGADALMLSGETASGKYPVKSLQTMSKIALTYETKSIINFENVYLESDESFVSISKYITRSAADAAKKLSAKAIIVPTESGYSARQVSKFRPQVPIYALTENETISRQLQLSRGVFPFFEVSTAKNVVELIKMSVLSIYNKKLISKEDTIVITSGHILKEPGHTSILEIFRVKNFFEK